MLSGLQISRGIVCDLRFALNHARRIDPEFRQVIPQFPLKHLR